MDSSRLFGLDLYRASAIVLLLLANVLNAFQIANPGVAQFAPIVGFVSLEIFFVLCGFLLGKSFYGIFMSENFSANDALRFVKHRILRIVPLYVLVLLINLVIAFAMDYPISNSWSFFFLLQNFSKPIPAFFPESWGLPVIFFATLMFVALLTALSRIIGQKQKSLVFFLATVGLIAVFLWTKWLYHTQNTVTDITRWDTSLKTVAIFRFDSVYIGTLFACLCLQARVVWNQIKWVLAFVGFNGLVFLAFGIAIFQLDIESNAAFWNLFYLPLTTVILCCFLPMLTAWESAPKLLQKPITSLSRMAYSIYLVHFSIVLLLTEHWLQTDFSSSHSVWILSFIYIFVSLILGGLLYYLFEKCIRKWSRS